MKQTKNQKVVSTWNKKNPIGTLVSIKRASGILVTTTRSKAAVVSGCAVIWLTGLSGTYLLKDVTPVKNKSIAFIHILVSIVKGISKLIKRSYRNG